MSNLNHKSKEKETDPTPAGVEPKRRRGGEGEKSARKKQLPGREIKSHIINVVVRFVFRVGRFFFVPALLCRMRLSGTPGSQNEVLQDIVLHCATKTQNSCNEHTQSGPSSGA
jgi:hypothetical protein